MTLTLQVPSIVCGGCVDTVTKAIQGVDAQAKVETDMASKTLTVDTAASEADVKAAIAATGHTVS